MEVMQQTLALMRVITETKCCQAETLTKERKFEFFLNSFIFNIEYYLKQIKETWQQIRNKKSSYIFHRKSVQTFSGVNTNNNDNIG